ncbi:MAG TPA: energy transducer TonB [Luteimonas sp.]|nr:energy transducer TonB [Luteimonas sp.]
MVLTQHRGFRFSFAVDDGANTLNPIRILVTAAALALHAAVLLVLIAPVTMPAPTEVDERLRTPPDIREKVEPPPKPPETVPVEQPPKTTTTTKPERTVVPEIPIITDRATDTYAPDVVEADPVGPVSIDPPAPAAVRLQYLNAPPPPYPRAAQTQHREGVVMLQITVDVEGRPVSVEIAQSSGHRDLDAAARAHVLKHWRFHPAMKDGQAIQAIGMVPIDFKLN